MADKESHTVDVDKLKANPLEATFVPADTKNGTSKAAGDAPPETIASTDEVVQSVPFHQIYKYASRNDLLCIYVGLLGALVTGTIPALSTWIFGTLVDTMVNLAMTLNTPYADVDGFWREVEMFVLYTCVLGIIMLGATYVSIMLFNYAAHNQIFRIRCEYLRAVLSKDIEWFDVNQSGEFASRMNEDLTKLGDGLGEKVVMFVHFLVTFLGSLIFSLVMGWQLALVSMAAHPITFLIIGVVALITARLAKREMEAYAKAGVIAEEAFGAVRTVIAFGGESKEAARYAVNLVEARKLNIRKAMFSGIMFGALWFCIYGTYALAFWYGVGLVIEHMTLPPEERVYTAGTMLMVLMAAMQAGFSMAQTSSLIEVFGTAMGAAAKVFSVIEQGSKINSMDNDKGDTPTGCEGSVQFSNVHFNYPSRPDVNVLQGISWTMRKGETVALVGSSGCGKSTCVQLIQRFYDPMAGSIMLDNRDIRELNVNWLRARIGVVGQEPVLFGTTIAENIRFGFEAATQADIEQAAQAANAHNFIMRMPQGYRTLVGERGAQMSGGQKQRIAIARALVRNPEILLLDEATSALDAASEAKVQAALDVAQRGRTTVIVAHRLSTIRNADRIIVLNAGKIVEQGNHAALIAKRGHYYELVTLQTGSVEQDGDLGKSSYKNAETVEDSDLQPIDMLPENPDAADAEPTISFWKVLQWNRLERWFLIAGTLCSVLQGVGMPIFAVVSGEIINVLSHPDPEVVRNESNTFVLVYVVAGVLVGGTAFIQIWTYGVAGERLTERLREAAFNAMLRMQLAWFDDKRNGTGTLCSRLSADAAAVQGATGQRIGTVVSSISTAVISIAIGMYYSWQLGLVSLAFTPFIILAHYYEIVLTNESNLGTAKALETSTKLAVEVVSNIRTVVSLGRERAFNAEYTKVLQPSLAVAKRLTHVRGFVYGVARSLMSFANAACIAYGAYLVVEAQMSIAAVFVVTGALISGSQSIAGSLAFAPNFTKGLTAAAKFDQLITTKPLIASPDSPVQPAATAQGSVRFDEAEFHYASRPNSRVLQKLSLDIQPGQSVALVGASGCGKSTCLQLIVRYYEATAGAVQVDGVDVRSLSLDDLRRHIGIVSQEPSLFDRTIAENIAYGDNTRTVTRAEIIEAATQANIHQFVATLPLGYDTRLGTKGTQLSGGQKQRVAIARALVRQPRLLLLDEATSALDMESEKVVQAALDAASVGRTCVTIAHRLSTIVNSDVIFVVHDGRVVERGTHKELLELQGLYHMMYTLQTGRSS